MAVQLTCFPCMRELFVQKVSKYLLVGIHKLGYGVRVPGKLFSKPLSSSGRPELQRRKFREEFVHTTAQNLGECVPTMSKPGRRCEELSQFWRLKCVCGMLLRCFSWLLQRHLIDNNPKNRKEEFAKKHGPSASGYHSADKISTLILKK